MAKMLEILELKLEPDHKQFGKLLSIQASMTSSVLTATARVRSGDLRGVDDDGVDGLLAELRREDEAPPATVTAEDLFAE